MSFQINFSIVNQYNCYQICSRNSNMLQQAEICDMQVSIHFDQVLGKRGCHAQQVFNFLKGNYLIKRVVA